MCLNTHNLYNSTERSPGPVPGIETSLLPDASFALYCLKAQIKQVMALGFTNCQQVI